MAQHDYSISNQGFPATRQDLNNVLDAIRTNNSGTTPPSEQYAGQFWLDTTSSNWVLYIHDGTDDIQFATIDTSANTVNFTDSALDVVTDTSPQLGGNLDLNSNNITGTGDINITGTGIFSGDLTVDTNTLKVDSSNNRVGIGTSSPEVPLSVVGLDTQIHFGEASDGGGYLMSTVDAQFRLSGGTLFNGSSWVAKATESAIIAHDGGTDGIKFFVNTGLTSGNSFTPTERMRINSDGRLLLGTTTTTVDSEAGIRLYEDGRGFFTSDGTYVGYFNRLSSDGDLILLRQAGINEGTISVSGSTVTYGGFTGTHWSRFIDNSKPTILKGTVLESLDEMCDWYNLHFETTTTTQDNDGNDVTNTENHVVPHVLQEAQSDGDVITYDWNTEKKDENDNDIIEQVQATIVKEADIKHMKSKVSNTVDAKNVYGVFSAYDEDGEGYNDFYVASVGSFVVRIKANETIAKGDLLQSNGDGTAKVQTDDAVRSSSFAKVLSTTVIETYDDGSYLVPCSLMC